MDGWMDKMDEVISQCNLVGSNMDANHCLTKSKGNMRQEGRHDLYAQNDRAIGFQ